MEKAALSKGIVTTAALSLLSGACAQMPSNGGFDEIEQAQSSDNGFALNGFALNGFALNGFALNGFALNGFALNGFALNGFALNGFALNGADLGQWFNYDDNGDIAGHAAVMKYMARCALSSGRVLSFIDRNGYTHLWPGSLGLADGWTDRAPTTDEQQLVSACMFAHANNAEGGPKNIQISLRGSQPSLQTTPIETAALGQYDGTFFGNLFSGGERYVCANTNATVSKYLETVLKDWGRQCYQDPAGCGVFTRVDCQTACTLSADGTRHESCTVGGKTYKAISVYIPRSKFARNFVSTATIGTCANCAGGEALNMTQSSTAKLSAPLGSVSGDVVLEVRYANGTVVRKAPATAYLKVTVGGKTVMNGLSANWDFPYTGGTDVWGTRLIRLTVPAGADIVLSGSTAGPAPRINVVSTRLP